MFKKHSANSNLRFFSDFISTNAVKNHRLSLLLLMLFTLLLLPAGMVAQTTNDQSETAYVVFDHGTGILTFKYGVKPAEGAYELNQNGAYTPVWGENSTAIIKVVFDESFKQARPTTCLRWFKNCNNLNTIENLQYLNASEVTQMNSMFKGCNNLTELDLSNFNTEKVTDMNNMFESCQNLTSLDLSSFNTAQVTDMSNMFEHCTNLVSLDLSNFNTANVESMKNMFDECKNLVSLDLSNFNTANVKNMDFMFSYCFKLETIYSDDFSKGSLPSSKNMFNNCLSLKGAIEYKNNAQIKDINGANYKDGYFTKLVGKNGSEKIGAAGSPLIAENLTLADDKDFVANATFIAKTASYSRDMKEGTTWGTLCLPFEVSLEGQTFRAFTLLSADEGTGTVVLKEIEKTIAAGTPVIIKMKDGKTNLSFTGVGKEIAIDIQNSNIVSGYQLQGLYTNKKFDKTADANCYIVKGGKLMNPAKMLENSKVTKVASKPFRAYMVDKTSSAPAPGAKMFSIGISDSATAIDTLNTIANDKAEYYDLQGKRLNEPQKGINIVKRGGKTMKVIIK